MPKVSAAQSGVQQDNLTGDENSNLEDALEKGLVDLRSTDAELLVSQREYNGIDPSGIVQQFVVDEYFRHVRFAAKVAKHDLDGSFDGMSPSSNNFGVDRIHPGYFGYDDWDDMPSLTGGDTSDWIDSSTPTNFSGSAGFANPMGIGDPVVHLILGFGSFASDPVTSRIKYEINEQPAAAISTEDEFRNTDLRLKILDSPIVLTPDDDFAARVYAGGEVGDSYEDAVYPFGLTFIEAKAYRILDPANMAGTSQTDIAVQQ